MLTRLRFTIAPEGLRFEWIPGNHMSEANDLRIIAYNFRETIWREICNSEEMRTSTMLEF